MVLFNPVLTLAPIDGQDPPRIKRFADALQLDPNISQHISPYHHVAKDQPPTIILFGTDDELLGPARQYMQAAQKAGNRCELITWDRMPHGFFNSARYNNRPFAETLRAADSFLTSLGYLHGQPTIDVPK